MILRTRWKSRAHTFLQLNRDELLRLKTFEGVEDLRLDFGVVWRNGFVQSQYLTPKLVALAGELEIGLEISMYHSDE